MGRKPKENDQTQANVPPNKATKKPPKSEGIVPKSDEIIVDSDAGSESGDAQFKDNEGDRIVHGAEWIQTSEARNTASAEPARDSTRDDGEGNSSIAAGEDEALQSQSAARQDNGRGDDEKEAGHSDHNHNQPRRRRRKASFREPTAGPPLQFQPPKGFEFAEPPDPSSVPLLNPLRPSNLQGKQLWHITAPAKFSMSDVKEFDFSKALNGEPLLNHKGTSYSIRQSNEPEHNGERLLIPSEKDEGLTAVSSNIVKTLHIHQFLPPPDTSFTPKMELKGTGASSCMRLPRSKPPPQQRRGLKMRHMPLPSTQGSCTIGSSDSESEEAGARPNGVDHTIASTLQAEKVQKRPSEFKKPEKSEKTEKAKKSEKAEKAESHETREESKKEGSPEKSQKPGKAGNSENAKKIEKTKQTEKTEKPKKLGKPAKPATSYEKPEQPEIPEKRKREADGGTPQKAKKKVKREAKVETTNGTTAETPTEPKGKATKKVNGEAPMKKPKKTGKNASKPAG